MLTPQQRHKLIRELVMLADEAVVDADLEPGTKDGDEADRARANALAAYSRASSWSPQHYDAALTAAVEALTLALR